jgi:RNA polymerase sigma-70 factor, ECF subfamily
VPEDPDSEPLSRLRTGDERTFAELAEKYQGVMLSSARGYVPSSAVAEEVVHDTWVGMLRGIGTFERRSSFRTWLFRILVNRAISAGIREHPSLPVDDMEPIADAAWFDDGCTRRVPPEPWADPADDRVIAAKWRPGS